MPGLASLLRRRTTNPRAAAVAAAKRRAARASPRLGIGIGAPYPMGQNPYESPYDPANPPQIGPPPGGKTGGVVGYQRGGRTTNPRATARRNRPPFFGEPRPKNYMGAPNYSSLGYATPKPPRGWQEGGPVGVSPEEVDMAADIYARAAPEQQAQITGGGGGPGMMDEEAAIGEALAMAMGGPPMNGGPPMGGMI